MMRWAASWVATVCLLGVGGCSGAPPKGVVSDCKSQASLPSSVSTDILFVIDTSSSMQAKQAKVVAQLGTFVDTLASAPVKHDFQVGVVTTGVTQNAAGCSMTSMPVLVTFDMESGKLQLGKDLQGQPVASSTLKIIPYDKPDLIQQFALLIQQGTSGSGEEMGLEAARLALTEPLVSTDITATPSGNKGFLRPGSRLLVIIVSDEDDCSDPKKTNIVVTSACGAACAMDSQCGGEGNYCVTGDLGGRQCLENACETAGGRAKLEPVKNYVDFLKNLDDGTGTGRKRDVVLAVIGAVDANGSPARCGAGPDEAQGVAKRYKEAVDAMNQNTTEKHGLIDSICAADYNATLTKIAELVAAPQVIELPGDPPDGSLVQIQIQRAGQPTILCRKGDGFSFEPAVGLAPARATLADKCRLLRGDKLDISFVCTQ